MISNIFKSSWKKKTEPINHFDNNFLNEKNKALEPLQFLFESEDILSKNDINKNKSTLKNKSNKDNKRKKSLKESDLYDSNIIIIESISEDESELTSLSKIERQVKKIDKQMKKDKQIKKYSSKIQQFLNSN